ncbi:MAG: hypothetical protein ABIQ93_00535, partial [Saprospiraceae bacterium]
MEEDLYTRIEDYLDHQLDAAARTAFEAALSADPELAEALAQVSEARTRLGRAWAQQEADDALHNTLQQLGREHFSNAVAGSPNPPLVAVRGRRWWIAAAAAVFAILLIWFFRAPSPADLYARYDQFPEAAFGTRAIGDSTQLNLVAAETAFNAGRYLEALPLLQRYLTSHPADQEKRFFSTLCQLALGQTPDAALFFR